MEGTQSVRVVLDSLSWVRSWDVVLPGRGLWVKPEGREGGLHCREGIRGQALLGFGGR